jgi:hypothetical protein
MSAMSAFGTILQEFFSAMDEAFIDIRENSMDGETAELINQLRSAWAHLPREQMLAAASEDPVGQLLEAFGPLVEIDTLAREIADKAHCLGEEDERPVHIDVFFALVGECVADIGAEFASQQIRKRSLCPEAKLLLHLQAPSGSFVNVLRHELEGRRSAQNN